MYLEENKGKRNLIMHWSSSSRGIPSIVENISHIEKNIDIPYMGYHDLQLQVNREEFVVVHKCPDF